MIVARNISKHFGKVPAVNNISFEVKKGQTLVLLGTSGCGKTTTLKMLNRLIEASSGEIFIDGNNIIESKPETLRKGIGYVSQNNGLFPHYTVAQNIAIVPKLLGWDKETIRKKSAFILNQLQLSFDTYAKNYPENLSGGQKQRVALARALVADPPVLLMDEPFGALDPVTRAEIRKEFKDLNAAERKSIILVTHDVSEAFELGDMICLMDQGRIIQTGTAKELIFKPENDFVRNFFSHQRLQLELCSVTFADVWNQFPNESTPAPAGLQTNQTLWTGMELLATSNRKTLTVSNEDGTSWKEISMSAIHEAHRYIKQNM
jgi:osmoprotectant transport system ATP-binding protein